MLGIFIDIEATGLDPYRHRCLEVAIELYKLSTMKKLATYSQCVYQSESTWKQSDPESLIVNGFNWEKCKSGKPEKVVADEIIAFLQKYKIQRKQAVFIGQNSSFDRAFLGQLIPSYQQEELQWPYHWLDLASMHWGKNLQHYRSDNLFSIPLSKNNIAKKLSLPPEQTPHRALNGVQHLVACYKKIMENPI